MALAMPEITPTVSDVTRDGDVVIMIIKRFKQIISDDASTSAEASLSADAVSAHAKS